MGAAGLTPAILNELQRVHRESNCTHTRVDLLIPFLPSRVPPTPLPVGPRAFSLRPAGPWAHPPLPAVRPQIVAPREDLNGGLIGASSRNAAELRKNCSARDFAIQSAVVTFFIAH